MSKLEELHRVHREDLRAFREQTEAALEDLIAEFNDDIAAVEQLEHTLEREEVHCAPCEILEAIDGITLATLAREGELTEGIAKTLLMLDQLRISRLANHTSSHE